jgi:peptidoglycan/LPS O-acetylase OafA/YrhL
MVAVVMALGYLLLLPKDLIDLAHSVLLQVFFCSNIYYWKDVGYFSGPSALKPLLHTWSLAVEEQFYLIFPIVFVTLHKYARSYITVFLLVGLIVSFVLSVYGSYHFPSATFYLLPTRAWELLTGSWVSVVGWKHLPKRINEILSILGFAFIGWGMFGLTSLSRFPGLNACFPVLGATFIIVSNSSELTATGRLLAHPACLYLGRISYSLYLWHWPLFAFFHYAMDTEPPMTVAISLLLSTFVLANLSYIFVEEPFRRIKRMEKPYLVPSFAFGSSVLLIFFAGWLVWCCGAPSRIPKDLQESIPLYISAPTWESLKNNDLPVIGDSSKSPSFIVWGDSHAGVAIPLFDELGKRFNIAGLNAAHGGNPPLPGCKISWNSELDQWNDKVLDQIIRSSIRDVFLIARWSSYIEGASDYDVQQGMFRDLPIIFEVGDFKSSDRASGLLIKSIEDLASRLKHIGCRTYILIQAPEQNFDPYRRCFINYRLGLDFFDSHEASSIKDYIFRQSRFFACLTELESCGCLDVIDEREKFFDSFGNSFIWINGSLLYRDHQHLSRYGFGFLFRDRLMQKFESMPAAYSSVKK